MISRIVRSLRHSTSSPARKAAPVLEPLENRKYMAVSPVFAGIMAIADQVSGRPHGFANPALYRLAGSKAFYDPRPRTGTGVVRVDYVNGVDAADGTTTSLRSIDTTVGTTLRVRRGYDDITGVGTPNGARFLGSLRIVR